MPLKKKGSSTRAYIRHSVSPDAVRTILRALRSSGIAQFRHPDIGGLSQWSLGMCMVDDMFNNSLKPKTWRGLLTKPAKTVWCGSRIYRRLETKHR
jgi:hypothetical protein